MLVPDAKLKRYLMLVNKMAKTVTKILYLSPTQFVSNIRHQHRCYPGINGRKLRLTLLSPYVNWNCPWMNSIVEIR